MTICSCGKPIPTSIVINNKRRNLQNRTKCLTCCPFGFSNYKKKSPEEARTFYALKSKKWYNDKKALLGRCPISIKRDTRRRAIISLTNGCQFCGYNNYPGNITFHHVFDKRFELSSRAFQFSWGKLFNELIKCCVCCRNCHGEIHGDLINTNVIMQYHNIFIDKLFGLIEQQTGSDDWTRTNDLDIMGVAL